MPRFPKVGELASELHAITRDLVPTNKDRYPHDEEDDGIDVRLRVTDDGWQILTGDPSYDQDHRGWWGCSSLRADYTMNDCRATARDLIDEAKDHHASSEVE